MTIQRLPKRDFNSGPQWDSRADRWLVEIRYPDGDRKRRRFRRKRQAESWWKEQQRLVDTGEWKIRAIRSSLGEALDQYRGFSKLHHRSYPTYVRAGLDWLEETLGRDVLLGKITTAQLEQIKAAVMEDRGLSPASVDKLVSSAKAFFNWCIIQGLASDNPVRAVRMFHENNERVRFLDPEREYPRFMTAVRQGPWYLEPICEVGLNSGLRRANLLGLRWADQIDFANQLIVVESNTKNGYPLRLPMNQTVFNQMQEVHKVTGHYEHVFTHTEGRFQGRAITDVKNAFNNAVRRAEIDDFHFHDMRHTFASWLIMKGVSLTAVQKLLGHRSIRMTLRYAHLAPGYLKNEVSVLDEIGPWKTEDAVQRIGKK